MSTPGPVPKHWLGFSYVRSKDHDLDMNFYETELEIKSDHTSNNKLKWFCENIVVIEEEWFAYITLTDGATFLVALIKFAKSKIKNKKLHVTQSDAYTKLQ